MTDIVERLRALALSKHDDLSVADEAADEIERLRVAFFKVNNEISQVLGKSLGYPWFKDDQKNFPGATESDGVAVGEHVAETLAAEAADEIERLRAFALKALTVIEWVAGQGFVLPHPHYDADDLLIEGVALLGVEDTNAARAAFEKGAAND